MIPMIACRGQKSAYLKRVITPCEAEVFCLLAQGFRLKEIAGKLGKSVKTVDHQKCSAMQKLGLRGVADVTRWTMLHLEKSEDFGTNLS